MIQVTDLLVTKTDSYFNTISDWIEVHGNCGTHHSEIVEIKLEVNDDKKSVTRTAWFNSESDFEEFEQERLALRRLRGIDEDDRPYTVERIQQPKETTL
jgi:hypothetical protein